MKNLKKRVVAIAATTAIAMTSLTGCGGFENNDVVATVGDSKITAGVANFYARYQQASMESYWAMLGSDSVWDQELSKGTTYEESMKDTIMDALKQLYVLEDHMEEYKVSLTDDEKKKISKAAAKFEEENGLKAKELVSGEKEVVEEILTLMTIENKMTEAMTKDVDTVVQDEDAAQKSMQYVRFPYKITDENGESKDLTEEEKIDLKTQASNFLNEAITAADFAAFAEEKGFTAETATFDKDSTSPAKEVIEAADALGEGAFTDVIETESGLYVAKVTSLLDREATDAKKESIVKDRKNKKFYEIYKEWEKDTKIDVDKKVWGQIDFKKVGVTFKQEEK